MEPNKPEENPNIILEKIPIILDKILKFSSTISGNLVVGLFLAILGLQTSFELTDKKVEFSKNKTEYFKNINEIQSNIAELRKSIKRFEFTYNSRIEFNTYWFEEDKYDTYDSRGYYWNGSPIQELDDILKQLYDFPKSTKEEANKEIFIIIDLIKSTKDKLRYIEQNNLNSSIDVLWLSILLYGSNGLLIVGSIFLLSSISRIATSIVEIAFRVSNKKSELSNLENQIQFLKKEIGKKEEENYKLEKNINKISDTKTAWDEAQNTLGRYYNQNLVQI